MLKRAKTALGVVLGLSVLAGCGDSNREVSFKNNIMPILEKYCLECHTGGGEGEQKSGVGLYTHNALMKGTKFGPIVEPGSSLNSVLYQVVSGKNVDPSIQMPHGRTKLNDDEIEKVKIWIDQGAKDN